MRILLTIISLSLSLPFAKAQQDAFSLRLGPEIGGGLGHQWGSDIDYNNGLLSGGLMFEGRMADAWGWALRPAYARSVALDKELGRGFGEHRFQLLTGPVWRADNGRTMRAYARIAPFIRLLGGAMAHTDINRQNLLPMAELGFGLKFRLNDRNDLELALAAQGAGTSQQNLQLAGMLSLAYHVNFKERKIKFRSPPLNLVPRATETEVTRNEQTWENPLLPSRGIEWSQPTESVRKRKQRKQQRPATEKASEENITAVTDQSSSKTQEVVPEAEIIKDSLSTLRQTETIDKAQSVAPPSEILTAEEPAPEAVVESTQVIRTTAQSGEGVAKTQPPTVQATQVEATESTEVVHTDTVIRMVKEVTVPATQSAPKTLATVPAQTTQPAPEPTAAAQPAQSLVVEIHTPPAPATLPVPVPMTNVVAAPAYEEAIDRLARQQEQMMAMLQQLNRSIEQLSNPQPQVPIAAQPTKTGLKEQPSEDGREELQGQLKSITEELARMAERMSQLEQQMTPPALTTTITASTPVAPAPTAAAPQPFPSAPASKSQQITSAPAVDKMGEKAVDATPSSHEVQFARNSYGLNADQAEAIRLMAERALADPKLTVIVEGYADRTGPAEFNAIIARKRGNEVLYELKRLGVPLSQTVFASYGDDRSLDDPSYRKVVVRLMKVE